MTNKVNLCRHWKMGLITHLNPTCPFCDIDALKAEIETLRTVEPMTEVADRFAHRLALELECVLADRPSYYNKAMQVLSEYRSAMNAIHEQHSPTFMGEPRI
jgi:hypothetical protein